jgi:hypothetical protein
MQPGQVSYAAPLASRHEHSIELAHILRSHGQAYMQTHPTSPEQRKVIRDVTHCRTEILGGHLEACGNRCGYERVSFHSCRNRHCPKCQNCVIRPKLPTQSGRSCPLNPVQVVHSIRRNLSTESGRKLSSF